MAHLWCDGPITASALVSALPDIAGFKSGRDLSAWLGLAPRPHSTGGKERLGHISKMANRMARTAYALMKNQTEYPVAQAA